MSQMKSTYTCPKDGGNLNVILDYEALKQNSTRISSWTCPKPHSGGTSTCCRWMIRVVLGHPLTELGGRLSINRRVWQKNWAYSIYG